MELAINYKHFKRFFCIKFTKNPCSYLFFHQDGVFNNKIYLNEFWR